VIGIPRYLPVTSPEAKVCDTSASLVAITTSGTQIHLTNITSGTSASSRIGNEIILKGITNRYAVATKAQTTLADETNIIRLIWVYDKQANAAAPGIASVLSTINPVSNFQDANKGRFIVLFDDFFGVGLSSDMVKCRHHSRRLNLSCLFVGASAIPETGSVYLIALSDSGVTPNPVLSYDIRLEYIDA
jgi:hypothetical protein